MLKSNSDTFETTNFSRLLREVNIREVPERLVNDITIRFIDGTSTTISGHYLPCPVQIRQGSVYNLRDGLANAMDIDLSIDLYALEEESTKLVNDLFDKAYGNFNSKE
jgi:hypothetical protein